MTLTENTDVWVALDNGDELDLGYANGCLARARVQSVKADVVTVETVEDDPDNPGSRVRDVPLAQVVPASQVPIADGRFTHAAGDEVAWNTGQGWRKASVLEPAKRIPGVATPHCRINLKLIKDRAGTLRQDRWVPPNALVPVASLLVELPAEQKEEAVQNGDGEGSEQREVEDVA